MSALTAILFQLFLIFLAAKVMGVVFTRLRQPAVIGELLAGVLIGPYALGWIGTPDAALVDVFHGEREAAGEALHLVQETIAELGVIVLLFFVGLETRVSDLLRVGPRSLAVGVLGIVIPFLLGLGIMLALGRPTGAALFTGTALVATSVGITARVLRDLGRLSTLPARIILGAAVIDDILALILLSVVVGIGAGAGLSWLDSALLIGQAVGFTLFVMFIGTRLSRRFSVHLERVPVPNAPLVVALLLMLGLATLAASIGLAAIIGAFLAGMVLAEAREQHTLEDQIQPVYDFLVPFFFVYTGTLVDWRLFLQGNVIGLALGVTALAILGKLVGCGLGAVGLSRRSVAIVGVGMVPRGEVGFIVASLGLSLGAISGEIFSVVVIMSILTTLVVPPVLQWLYRASPNTHNDGKPAEELSPALSDI